MPSQEMWNAVQGFGIGLGFAVVFLLLMLPFLKYVLNIFAGRMAENLIKSNALFADFIVKVGVCSESLNRIAESTKTIAESGLKNK